MVVLSYICCFDCVRPRTFLLCRCGNALTNNSKANKGPSAGSAFYELGFNKVFIVFQTCLLAVSSRAMFPPRLFAVVAAAPSLSPPGRPIAFAPRHPHRLRSLFFHTLGLTGVPPFWFNRCPSSCFDGCLPLVLTNAPRKFPKYRPDVQNTVYNFE